MWVVMGLAWWILWQVVLDFVSNFSFFHFSAI